MKKILHIIATPRDEQSRTLAVSSSLLAELKKRNPRYSIEEIDLFKESLPHLTAQRVDGKYVLLSGKELDGDVQKSWAEIIKTIERFLSADGYVISTPMWNFGIPYVLKHYIDVIFQPRYLFRYTSEGPEGLLGEKKMVVVTSRGGDYSKGSPSHSFDQQEPYLRTAFGFAGIKDIHFINAQPMDAGGEEAREKALSDAVLEAKKAVSSVFNW